MTATLGMWAGLQIFGGTADEAIAHINELVRRASPFKVTLIMEKHLDGGRIAVLGMTVYVGREVFDRMTELTP